ncbi:plant self-incompatibility S1 [Artemisia annua]|uniref:S-protein homolog n=1 Tax=Artemisia annua TaxID=35608 RepID=A0A2U1QB24_ARTAN|nr:plant self-incompatibility S1 [Artemisia annua]
MNKLFIIFILTCTFASLTHACVFTNKWHIFVMSDMPDNDLIAHVKSGDDDLGIHTIAFRGTYHWSFCQRFDGRTLFYAYFWCGSKFRSLALFDKHIRKVCDRNKEGTQYCYWLVRPDGFFASKRPDGGWVQLAVWS